MGVYVVRKLHRAIARTSVWFSMFRASFISIINTVSFVGWGILHGHLGGEFHFNYVCVLNCNLQQAGIPREKIDNTAFLTDG